MTFLPTTITPFPEVTPVVSSITEPSITEILTQYGTVAAIAAYEARLQQEKAEIQKRLTQRQAEKTILISDWKNYQVQQGDILDIYVNVHPTLQKWLSHTSTLKPALDWVLDHPYWSPGGILVQIINKVLNASTQVGLLKNKIKINEAASYMASDFSKFVIRVEILQNAWPLIIVCATILGAGAFLYFSIGKVEKILHPENGAEWLPLFVGGFSLGTVLTIVGAIVFLYVLRK